MALGAAAAFPLVGLALVLRNFATFQSQIARVETLERQLEDTQERLATSSQRRARAIGVLGGTMLALGTATTSIIAPMVKLAGVTEGFSTAMTEIGRATGATRDEIEQEREELEGLLVNTDHAYRAMQDMAQAQLDVKDTSDLARMALDLTTVSTKSAGEILTDLTTGIRKQTTQTLKSYGATATADRVFTAYAATLGKTATELTQAERSQALYNYTLNVGQGYAGAWIRSAGQLNTEVEILRSRWRQIGLELAQTLLPEINRFLDHADRLLDWFEALPKSTQQTIFRFVAFGGALSVLIGTLSLFSLSIRPVLSALGAIPSLLFGGTAKVGGTAVNAGKGLIAGVKLLGKSFVSAGRATGGILKDVTEIGRAFGGTQGLGMALGFLRTAVSMKLGPVLAGGLLVAKTAVFGLLGSLLKLAVGIPILVSLGAAAAALVTDFGGLRTAAQNALLGLGDSLKRAAVDALPWFRVIAEQIAQFFDLTDKKIREKTEKLTRENFGFEFDVDKFFTGGLRIIEGFVRGIISGLIWGVGAITDVLGTIADLFIGRSPPPSGPLSDIDEGGVKTIQSWIDGMLSVPLDPIKKLVDRVSKQLRRALWEVEDAAFAIDVRELGLDKMLYDIQDALFLIRAEAELITIPLQRQLRPLQRQLDLMQDFHDEQEEALEERIDALERQRDLIQDMLELDRERLELIEHELFMEDLRNRILRRETSGRELELRAQAEVQRDVVARREQELKAAREQLKAEKDRADQQEKVFRAQEKALEKQIEALDRLIQVQEDRVLWQEEELRLAEARQAQQRLAIQQDERYWDEQRLFLDYYNTVLGRARKLMKDLNDEQDRAGDIMEEYQKKVLELPQILKIPSIEIPEEKLEEIREKFAAMFARIDEDVEELKEGISDMVEEWDLMTTAVKDFLIRLGLIKGETEENHVVFNNWLDDVLNRWFAISDVTHRFFDYVERFGLELFGFRLPFAVQRFFQDLEEGFLTGWLRKGLEWLFPPGGELHQAMAEWERDLAARRRESYEMYKKRRAADSRRAGDLLRRLEEFDRDRRRRIEDYRSSQSNAILPPSMRQSSSPQAAPRAMASRSTSITRVGPTVNLTANYAETQSPVTVRDDVRMLLSLYA